MSERMAKHYELLRLLSKANHKQRKALIENTNNEFIYCICECIQNLLKGNVPCSHVRRTKLKQSADVLRQIVHRRTPLKQKRELLVQQGGFLPALLAPIVGIAGGLIGDLLGNLIRK